MKTRDIKPLLLGILAVTLVITLMSSKSSESASFNFIASPTGVGIYNHATKTIYMYKVTLGAAGIQEKPNNIYKFAEDGSSLTKID